MKKQKQAKNKTNRKTQERRKQVKKKIQCDHSGYPKVNETHYYLCLLNMKKMFDRYNCSTILFCAIWLCVYVFSDPERISMLIFGQSSVCVMSIY